MALAACSSDRVINPMSDDPESVAVSATTASTITAHYDLTVGQSVKITPKSTTRTNRLRWTSTNTSVANVSSSGSVSARSVGLAVVTVSGNGVLESYEVDVSAIIAPPAPTVTSFSLQPKTGVTLMVGQAQQFATNVTWSDNQVRTATVTYTATGGTISSTGLFTAGNVAGTFMVIATCACTSPAIADTALVSVTMPQLTSLTVSPKTASLNAGATQQFAVSALWNTGATTVPPVTWSATGGSVSATGLYTAPATAGTYRVIVAHTNGTVRDTAVVTVSAPVTAPAASAPFFSDNFDNGQRNNASGFAWGGGSAAVTVSDVNSFSGTHSLRFSYAATPTGGDANAEQRFDMGRYLSEVWIEYMIFIPSNFKHRNDSPSNNKFLMLWRDTYSDVTGGTWRIGMEYVRRDDFSSNLRFMSSRWDVNSWTDGGAWPTPAPQNGTPFIGAGPLQLGAWNRVRFHVKAASSRVAEDGQVQLWINNTLQLSYNNGRFHNAYSSPADAVLRNGYFLGWANSGFTDQTDFFVDDVKFYQTNPGW